MARGVSQFELEAKAQGLKTAKEVCALLKMNYGTFQWHRRHREVSNYPMPTGKLLGGREFYDAHIMIMWNASRPAGGGQKKRKQSERHWPPTGRQFRAHTAEQCLRPAARFFPDNGEPIPEALNPITGNMIRPKWRACLGCGSRFISVGPQERYACTVPEAARGKPTSNSCVTKNTTGMSDMAD